MLYGKWCKETEPNDNHGDRADSETLYRCWRLGHPTHLHVSRPREIKQAKCCHCYSQDHHFPIIWQRIQNIKKKRRNGLYSSLRYFLSVQEAVGGLWHRSANITAASKITREGGGVRKKHDHCSQGLCSRPQAALYDKMRKEKTAHDRTRHISHFHHVCFVKTTSYFLL